MRNACEGNVPAVVSWNTHVAHRGNGSVHCGQRAEGCCMRDTLISAFITYPFVVNLISAAAGAALFVLLVFLRRKRRGKGS